MRPLDVGGFFEFPAACWIERGGDAIFVNHAKVRGREAKLGREIGQIARRVWVVVGVNDGDNATSARRILCYDVRIACSSLAAHKMVEARVRSQNSVTTAWDRRTHLGW